MVQERTKRTAGTLQPTNANIDYVRRALGRRNQVIDDEHNSRPTENLFHANHLPRPRPMYLPRWRKVIQYAGRLWLG